MNVAWRLNLLLLAVSFFSPYVAAQQIDSGAHPTERIYIDAVVTPANGARVENLQERDFTIFDNDVPQTITSFEAIDARRAQISVIIVVDTLSLNARAKGTTLEDIKSFLKSNNGELAYPTTVDFVTDKGLEFKAGPSRNGKLLASSLEKPATETQDLGNDEQWSPIFRAFVELVTLERDKPGRKIILFVSAGWPPVMPQHFERTATNEQLQHLQQVRLQVFGNIVQLTRQLANGHITVYSVDPLNLGDPDAGFNKRVYNISPSRAETVPVGVHSASDVRSVAAAWRFTPARTSPQVCNKPSPAFHPLTNSPSIPSSPMRRICTTI
jgi:VWFA-related protein